MTPSEGATGCKPAWKRPAHQPSPPLPDPNESYTGRAHMALDQRLHSATQLRMYAATGHREERRVREGLQDYPWQLAEAAVNSYYPICRWELHRPR